MRCHYAVLVVLSVALLVAHAQPIERDEQTTLEESFADTADKKDQVHMNDDVEEATGDKKDLIATNAEEKKEEEEGEEEGDKEDEGAHEDSDVTEDDVTKKDDVKSSATKENKEKKEKTPGKVSKKHDASAKKWWMVEGAHKWGGMGHSHWGPPHQTETETEHHDEGHFEGPEGEKGVRKGKVHHASSCCKSKSKSARKRCGCPHPTVTDERKGHNVKGHENGYHFHDKGGARSHNNDHDHELRGPWAFGYDGFGDDWGDWDHNTDNFQHLKDLEHESHGGHHEDVHEHENEADKAAEDCGSKRDCVAAPPPVAPVVAAADDDGIDAPLAPPLGAAVAVAPLPASAYPMPVPVLPPPVAQGHALPYRVCHACHVLPDGGSRCLCKAVHHARPHHIRPHHANTHFNHHVYIDCDAAVHNYPADGHNCRARHDLPTPEHSKTASDEN